MKICSAFRPGVTGKPEKIRRLSTLANWTILSYSKSVNHLFVRTLTLTSILLAILAALYIYEVRAIKTPNHQSNQPSIASQSALQSKVEVTGPGGCKGFDQCLTYCQNHPSVCAKK